jgi:hypothetical protein
MTGEHANESVTARLKADLAAEIDRVSGGTVAVETTILLAGGGRVSFAFRGMECASATYEIRLRHAGLRKSKVFRGRDVSTWTDELWAKARSTGVLSINQCVDEWNALVRAAVDLAKGWVQQRRRLLEDSENSWDSGTCAEHGGKRPPLSWWINWRLAVLRDELHAISDQFTASWEANDPLRMKLDVTHQGLKMCRTITGANVFDMAETALLQAEEWDALWEDREFSAPLNESGRCASSAMEFDVLSSLLNLGCQRANAEHAVRKAKAEGVGDGFESLFRRALELVR